MKQIEIKLIFTKDDAATFISSTYNAEARYPIPLGNVPSAGCTSIGDTVRTAMDNLAPMLIRALEEEFTKMAFQTGAGQVSDGQTTVTSNILCPKSSDSLDHGSEKSLSQQKAEYLKQRKEVKETNQLIANINREFSDTYPPVGLRPEYNWKALRLQEIKEAIQRYIEVDKDIPAAWIKEHDALDQEITEYNIRKNAAPLKSETEAELTPINFPRPKGDKPVG